MKTLKSIIKISAVAAAVVTMSGCLTSCDVLVDTAYCDPYYYHDTYVVHDYGPRYYGGGYYTNHYVAPVYPSTGGIVCGRR